MPTFFGLCGRVAPTPCKLAWASTYPNKVGVYPNQFLPARRTVYHAASDIGLNFTPPIVGQGETFGLPLGGLIGGFDQFGPPQFDTFVPQSHIATIFARTANRLNVPHVVTQAEINSALSNGNVTIDVGEYLFEFIGVTDQVEVFNTQLTAEELEDINDTGEAESDKAFRKLFEQAPPASRNRLINIETNKRGIEYRFDNGDPKVNSALKLAGIGDLKNPSYRDGSSRKIVINLNKITERLPLTPGSPAPQPGSLQAEARAVQAGDIIYFSYVAIKQHYIRQNVEAAYTIQAMSIPPQAFGFPSKILVANYRFYEWLLPHNDSTQLQEKVGGWRIVESHNIPTNVVAPVGNLGSAELGQFLITKGAGVTLTNVLDTRNITVEELDTYINNRPASLRQSGYFINLNQQVFNGNYHQQTDQSFKLAPWYLGGSYSTYTEYSNLISHVFYNVHPSAMFKRDVDKWGIERTMAQAIEIDIKQGKDTFFPFMDDVSVINPTQEVTTFLSSSNTKFEPFQPLSRYTVANLEIEAGVAGAVQLGNTGSTDDIVAILNYTSNIMTEKFAEDTRVLAERHFSVGQRGPRTIAIEGLAGQGVRAVTCVADPSNAFSFAAHLNADNFLTFNKFTSAIVYDGLRGLTYRPDLAAPNQVENEDPQPSQFVDQLGFTGLIGEKPGITPGTVLSYSNYANVSSFLYKTTNRAKLLQAMPSLTEDQINEISVEKTDSRIVIPIGSGYAGRTEIDYLCSNPGGVSAYFQFKEGGLEGVIDSISFSKATDHPLQMIIPHYWMKGDTIEIVGENINTLDIQSVTVQQLKTTKSVDFLDNTSSSTVDEKIGFVSGINLPTRALFFETDVMSLGEDEKSRLFIFFNDNDDGISCVMSINFGQTWMFYYGIIEPVNQQESKNPFVINSLELRGCFLFYQFMGKILCKFIPFELFHQEDAMLIQRFEKDILSEDENGNKTESGSLFSADGQTLRRGLVGFAAAGDLTDTEFRQLAGRSQDRSNVLEDLEVRQVENSSGELVSRTVRKNPVAIASGTAFTRKNVEDIYFSAYKTDKGVLKLFFLGATRDEAGGGNQIQCHFSDDNGRTWYDYWEWIEYGYNRARTDAIEKTQFIDRSATRASPTTIEGTDPLISELYYFGLNIHWSRLAKHKTGSKTLNAESQVLTVESPYVFYQKSTKKLLIFYIYESCLLCKMFNEEVFLEASKKNRTPNGGGMAQVKDIIEKSTRSHFVDGDLSDTALREEIHRYFNEETNEVMAQGNIEFNSHWSIDTFNENRRISAQRICAYNLPQGGIRVFYKHDNSNNLRAAIWTGSSWIVEDLLKPTDLDPPQISPPTSFTEVCGGFNGSGFPCEGN